MHQTVHFKRENRQSESNIMQSHYWLCTTKSTSGFSGTQQKSMPLLIPYLAKDVSSDQSTILTNAKTFW